MFKDLLRTQLDAYAQLLTKQVHEHGYCGEFISDVQPTALNDTRLLCQTRGIFFLLDYAQITQETQYVALAKRLFELIQNTYYDAQNNSWTQYPLTKQPQNTAKDKMLYEYAFVITAYAKLYAVTQNQQLLKLINEVKTVIFKDFYNHQQGFSFLEHVTDGINQNALMHLFESFVEISSVVNDQINLNDLQQFGEKLLNLIYDKDVNLIREYSNKEMYEPGHSFEWASLIYEAVTKGFFSSPIPHQKLAISAEKHGVYQNLALSEFIPHQAINNDDQIRIWPSLERLRYYAMTNSLTTEMVEKLLLVFFSPHNLPYEYVDATLMPQQEKVKATTGYHIINCYKYILNK